MGQAHIGHFDDLRAPIFDVLNMMQAQFAELQQYKQMYGDLTPGGLGGDPRPSFHMGDPIPVRRVVQVVKYVDESDGSDGSDGSDTELE